MKLKQICNESEIGKLVDKDYGLSVFVKDNYRIIAIKRKDKYEIQKIFDVIKKDYVEEIK